MARRLRPNLVCLGAAKAGTTALATVLGAHPDIYVPPQKELNALHYNDLDDRVGEYMAYFREAGDVAVRCDFSVRYLSSPNAPAAAARLTPDTRLMVILRNPVDQIQSHYWHLRRQNFHQARPVDPPPDLFEALDWFPELLLEPALYGKHLERWLALFPRDRMLVIDHADMLRDLQGTLDRICDFVAVDRFDFTAAAGDTSAQDGRAGVQPRGGLAGRLFPRLYVGVARGPYTWLKRLIGVQGADRLKRLLRLREASEALFFKSGYPRLDQTDRRRLQDRLAEDRRRLDALVLIDTSRWKGA
ncbi:MAG: sulfotransferase [Caulobacter sp.]|nr:sulfotransferase [Caulobacter sp.]